MYLPKDYYTHRPRGFGFVEFWSADDAQRAKAKLNGFVLDGRELEVTVARKGRSAPHQMVNTSASLRSRDASTRLSLLQLPHKRVQVRVSAETARRQRWRVAQRGFAQGRTRRRRKATALRVSVSLNA